MAQMAQMAQMCACSDGLRWLRRLRWLRWLRCAPAQTGSDDSDDSDGSDGSDVRLLRRAQMAQMAKTDSDVRLLRRTRMVRCARAQTARANPPGEHPPGDTLRPPGTHRFSCVLLILVAPFRRGRVTACSALVWLRWVVFSAGYLLLAVRTHPRFPGSVLSTVAQMEAFVPDEWWWSADPHSSTETGVLRNVASISDWIRDTVAVNPAEGQPGDTWGFLYFRGR